MWCEMCNNKDLYVSICTAFHAWRTSPGKAGTRPSYQSFNGHTIIKCSMTIIRRYHGINVKSMAMEWTAFGKFCQFAFVIKCIYTIWSVYVSCEKNSCNNKIHFFLLKSSKVNTCVYNFCILHIQITDMYKYIFLEISRYINIINSNGFTWYVWQCHVSRVTCHIMCL